MLTQVFAGAVRWWWLNVGNAYAYMFCLSTAASTQLPPPPFHPFQRQSLLSSSHLSQAFLQRELL